MFINKFALTNIIIRTEDSISSELDGEVVMMSIEQGEYYGLGQIGSTIWRFIEKPTTLQQIVEQCIEQYDVDFNQCHQDVALFLIELNQKGLISYSSQ